MSRQGLRTILCCSVSGAGLWAVAAGFLTHHVAVSKVGAFVALAGALLMFVGPADASNFDGLPPPLSAVPARIQRPPQGYQNPASFSVHTMPSYEIGYLCHDLGATSAGDLACTLGQTVYMPNPCEFRGDRYADLLCHEAGHVQGWPANHPSEDRP